MTTERHGVLAKPDVQATLLAEAISEARVGFVVWDDDRHYVAASARACELLGCTLEELLGSVVGSRATDGDETIERIRRSPLSRGQIVIERFDGRPMTLEYVTFRTRTAGLPHMASVIWEAED